MHTLSTIPGDGKLYAIKGYTGIKIRCIKQSKHARTSHASNTQTLAPRTPDTQTPGSHISTARKQSKNPRKKHARSTGRDWSYYIYYRIGGRQGKQFLQKVGTKSQGMTLKKAQKIRMQKIMESEQALNEQKNIVTIADIWKEYEQQKNMLSSFASIKHCYQYLEPFYTKTPLTISTKEITFFRQELENRVNHHGKKLSAQTIAHILKLLRTLINFAVKNELSPKNTTLYFDIPKVQNTVNEYLSEKQLKQYITALQGEENIYAKAFFMTALYTGMRKKAIYYLAWQDIDYKHNIIYLQAKSAKKRQLDFIPLPASIKQILKKLPQNGEYIFMDNNKKPYANYFQTAKTIKEKIGLPKNYRPLYMLRHNFASLLANSGTNLYTIQKLLTHNSPAMTVRYAHLNDKTLQESSKRVSKIIQKYFDEADEVL